MSNYTPIFEPFYNNGWENQPSENTPIMGEALDEYDSTFKNIESFLANLDLSGLGADYALLTEAGYSLAIGIDSNYVMTISLKNKAGTVLDSKSIDFPIESMVVNATYANGIVTFTLQNGNVLDVDISDLVRGLVPTSRTIAGVDLADDITAEELKEALGMYDEGLTAGTLKPWLYDTSGEEVVVGVYGGKPLYRKYFTINLTTNEKRQGTVSISDYIENFEKIISHKVFTQSMNLLPCIYKDEGNLDINDITYFVNVGGGIIVFTHGSNISTTEWKLPCIFEYTKTTDAEGSGNNLNPYGIYDAKMDDVKASIASVSDEVDAVEEQLAETNTKVGKLKYEWTANIKCATWSRLCYVERLTVYDCSYLIQLSFTRSGVIVTDTFLVTAMGSGYGSIVKVCGNNYGALKYSVRITLTTAGDGYFEIYDDMGGATSDTTQTIRCSLIPIATRDISTSIAGADGTTIPDGYRVAKEILVTKTDFQSDVTDALQSNIDTIKYPVKLFDINSNTYSAGDTLGGAINMSLYSGFILYFTYGSGGYAKEIRAIGDMKSSFYWLEMTGTDGKYYSAGVQVRNAGLFVETVGANKPYLVSLYGIPA